MEMNIDEMLNANLPDGALTDTVNNGSDDERLSAAAAAAAEHGSSTPLVREELRLSILTRRFRTGQPELRLERTAPKAYELTEAEKIKKERRKEQNRRAAKKLREKRKIEQGAVQRKHDKIKDRHRRLSKEVNQLTQFKNAMKSWLMAHQAICNVRPQAPQQEQQQQHQHQHQQHNIINGNSHTPGSQGLAACHMPSEEHTAKQSLILNSVDMEAAIRDLAEFAAANPLDGGPDQATAPSVLQPVTHPPALPPKSTESLPSCADGPPNSGVGFQTTFSTISMYNQESESDVLDLPGYPFSTQRPKKRMSVDGNQQVPQASCKPGTIRKSQTHPPRRTSTPSAPATVTSASLHNAGFPPSPISPASQHEMNLAGKSCCGSAPPVTSLLTTDPCYFRFPGSLTPPPRCSSVTPPPPPYHSQSLALYPYHCSVTPPPPSPGGMRVVPGSELPTPAPSPALSIFEERANDDEVLLGGLSAPFVRYSSPETECLSSTCSLMDFLHSALSSSQED